MNIQDMHNTFRVVAQQMGMQLNRGILPESIDIYINNAITEISRTVLLEGVRTAHQDTIDSQTTAMSNINAFRDIYKTMRYEIPSYTDEDYINDSSKIKYYNPKNGYYILRMPTINSKVGMINDEYHINPMMYLGFSLEYDKESRGSAISARMIGADQLETTLADYCNGASKTNPIVCLSALPNGSDDNINNKPVEQLEIFTNTPKLNISYINIKYIKTPNIVKLDINNPENNVDCDLPSYLHYQVVKLAVNLYYESIGAFSKQDNK